jgi:hypothetical protein
VAEGEVDRDELLEGVSVSSVLDSYSWEGYDDWTAGMVGAVIEKIVPATDEEPEELLEAAIRSAWRKAKCVRREAEKVEQDLDTIIGSASSLKMRAGEIDALQARRLGGSAPFPRPPLFATARR